MATIQINFLRYLQMGISWQQDVFFLVCPLHYDMNKPFEIVSDIFSFLEEPESHIRGDLVVARTTCVQFPTNRSNEFAQSSFIGGVNILVVYV